MEKKALGLGPWVKSKFKLDFFFARPKILLKDSVQID